MSDFAKGPWCEVWDGLFWRFVDRHREALARNPRLAMMVGQYDRLEPDRRKRLANRAEAFLDGLGA